MEGSGGAGLLPAMSVLLLCVRPACTACGQQADWAAAPAPLHCAARRRGSRRPACARRVKTAQSGALAVPAGGTRARFPPLPLPWLCL